MKSTNKYTILHNTRCRKSREGLLHLQTISSNIEIVEYLKEPITKEYLSDIVSKLGISAEQLVRKSEAVYKESFKGKTLSNDEWIEAMIQYPKLIERPIVVKGDKAVVARPAENINQL